MYLLIWNLDRVIRSSVSATLPTLVKIVTAVAPHVVVKYTGRVPILIIIIFVFIFFDTQKAYTHEPILTHNSSKDAEGLKEVPFQQVFFDIFTFWGSFSPKPPIFHC